VDGRIGALHCDYLVPQRDPAVVDSLDRSAREDLARELAAALDAVYADDPTVYLVREVEAELALDAGSPDLVRRWARALATAVVETVAADPGDGANVVTFADQADYLAQYLTDHVHGQAEGHWYFAPLSRFHALPSGEAVAAVLDENPTVPVLAALHRRAVLPEVLAVLDTDALTALASGPADVAEYRPLVEAAVRIADLRELWTGAPLDVAEVERLYRRRPALDWRSPTALTAVVVDVLDVLASTGAISLPARPLDLGDEFTWLDGPLLPDAPSMGPREESVLRLLLDALAGEPLRARVVAAGPGPLAVILLRAALGPEWLTDRLADHVVARVVDLWRIPGVHKGLSADEERVVRVLSLRDESKQATSRAAGVLLLLRAVADLRLPAVLARAGFPEALPATLSAVAMRLTGEGPDDPAVQAFAGWPDDELWRWRRMTPDQCAVVRDEVVWALRGLRVSDDQTGVEALSDVALGVPHADEVIGLIAVAVLRTWAKWLGGFAESSVPYLLDNFVHRPGVLRVGVEELVVELEAGPLDVVVQVAGYDRPVERLSWLGGRRVVYRMGAA
jgi:hypothetical protein